MAFRTENGKVVLLALSDEQLRLLSNIQFGSMRPMNPESKAKIRGATHEKVTSENSEGSGGTTQIL